MAELILPRPIPIHFNDYDVFKSPLSDFKTKDRARRPERHLGFRNVGMQ